MALPKGQVGPHCLYGTAFKLVEDPFRPRREEREHAQVHTAQQQRTKEVQSPPQSSL